MSFAESMYSVNENDGVLQPVLVLSESSSTNITITVEADDITATGKISVVTQAMWYVIVIILQEEVLIIILDHTM